MGIAWLMDTLAKVHIIRGVGAVAIFVVYLGLCVFIGFWAGAAAQKKGRSFWAWFALGTTASLFWIFPGIIVLTLIDS